MKRTLIGSACVLLALAGCGNGAEGGATPRTVSPPIDDGVVVHEPSAPPAAREPVATPPVAPTRPPPAVPVPVDPTIDAPLPTDERPVVSRDVPPPPISGGTLIIARDGRTAIAADPDRDRVVFVDLVNDEVLGQVTLDSGAEPGRLAEDASGRVHVALRGTGELATLDVASRTLLDKRAVCGAPRGVAYDAREDALHVACLDGALVTLAAADRGELRNLRGLGTDLRDVTPTSTGLRVTRFRSASVLELDAAGEPRAEHALRMIEQSRFDPFDGSQKTRTFEPTLARRAVAFGDDATLVLHERAMLDAVELDDPHDGAGDPNEPFVDAMGFGGGIESAYGSAGGCTSIVQTAVSVVDGEGMVRHSFSLAGAVLPVDVAVSPDRRMVAVADAGRHDPNAPLRGGFFEPGFGGLTVFSLVDGSTMTDAESVGEECVFGDTPVEGQPVAVAFTPDGALVVQSREPATLQVLSSVGVARTIALGGGSRFDTGHDIFHRDAGAAIACASCHGEGGDDGHVWTFDTLGPRRTQSVNVGLEGTEPFHWSGDMANLSTLVREVFVDRMGGVLQSSARVDALSGWLFSQRAPKSLRAADDAAAKRGKQLFESEQVGCASCHAGSALTNNETVDVGTGEPLQVPSLVGIAYRAPFIHTGCAPTLRDRFDPDCGGGDKHGRTSQLGKGEIDDLVAYLESL